VRLLLDQNLSPRLLTALDDLFPGSTHVREVGLQAADDDSVWRYAAAEGLTIVSKDADLSSARGKVRSSRLGSLATERYYRARYYHTDLQRFISEDPIGFAGGDPNLYAYVGNNPLSFRDPHGRFADPVTVAITTVILAAWIGLSFGGDQTPVLTGRNSHDDDKPYERIAFGQKRISYRFGNYVTLYTMALGISLGAQPELEVTRFEGQLAAVNNRTLAAYGIAGIRPINLIPLEFKSLAPEQKLRFYEPGVPSFVIPVTRDRAGNDVLFEVEAPR